MLTKIEFFCSIAERDPVIERDESVVRAGQDSLELRLAQFAIDPQGDIERDRFFRRAVPAPGAAVFAAMAGIDHDGIESVAGVGRDGRATAEQKSGRQGERGDGAGQTLH